MIAIQFIAIFLHLTKHLYSFKCPVISYLLQLQPYTVYSQTFTICSCECTVYNNVFAVYSHIFTVHSHNYTVYSHINRVYSIFIPFTTTITQFRAKLNLFYLQPYQYSLQRSPYILQPYLHSFSHSICSHNTTICIHTSTIYSQNCETSVKHIQFTAILTTTALHKVCNHTNTNQVILTKFSTLLIDNSYTYTIYKPHPYNLAIFVNFVAILIISILKQPPLDIDSHNYTVYIHTYAFKLPYFNLSKPDLYY